MPDIKNSNAEPIVLGALRGAYGLKGWVRVLPFQDGDALLDSRDWVLVSRTGESRPLVMEQAKFHGNGIIAKIKGIDTPEDASALKGAVGLYREDFPELEDGEYYWVDLMGCLVKNSRDEKIGVVKSVFDAQVHDVLDVKRDDGKSALIPFVPNYILEVNLEGKEIVVDWSLDWD